MANGSAAPASLASFPPPPPARSSPAQGVALVVVVVASLRVFRIFEMDCLRRFSQGGQLSCH